MSSPKVKSVQKPPGSPILEPLPVEEPPAILAAFPEPTLRCPECGHPFRAVPTGDHGDMRPFLLPACGHTVCGACASAQAATVPKAKEPGGAVSACPVCSEICRMAPTLHSLFATAAEAKYQRELASVGALECETCLDVEDERTPATHVCVGCKGEDRPLCAAHLHKKHPALVPVSKYSGPTPSGPAGAVAAAAYVCGHHPKYEVDRFCFTCEASACVECCLTTHPLASHDVKALAEAADTLRSRMDSEAIRNEAASILEHSDRRVSAVDEAREECENRFRSSLVDFDKWIEDNIAALRKLQSDVKGAGQAKLRAKTGMLHAKAKCLRVFDSQAIELMSLMGQMDPDNTAALACVFGVAGVMKKAKESQTDTVEPYYLSIRCKDVVSVLANSAWVSAFSPSMCEVSGPGLDDFVSGGPGAVCAEVQNRITLVCRDDKGEEAASVRAEDVSLSVSSAGAVVGGIASLTCDRPGAFTLVYYVSGDVTEVDVGVEVCGESVVETYASVITPPEHMFRGSTVLSYVLPDTLREFAEAIVDWLPTAGQPTLLFRMTRDGKRTSDFHSRCDDVASTITLIKSTNGYVFGGYAGAAWHSDGGFIKCSTSFIFTVSNPHNISPTRYPVNNHDFALQGLSTFGPVFGYSALAVGSGDSSLSSGGTPFVYYTDTTGMGPATFTGQADASYAIAEVEVWQVPVAA